MTGKDGVDHINVYSKGETVLGRFLSNFAHTPIETEDGHFESIEGYWYWLGAKDERLRTVYGHQAKQLGKSLPRKVNLDEEVFQKKICEAIKIKLSKRHDMLQNLKQSPLPLEHYYVYGGKKIDAGYKWILDFINSLREEKPMKTLFFTGHRPNGLPGGWANWPKYEPLLMAKLSTLVFRAYTKGFRNFVSGGALGTDQAAAKAVIEAKKDFKDIHLTLMLPFIGFDCKWPPEARGALEKIDNQADLTQYVCDPPYESWKMQKRNEAMVDASSCGIALWSGMYGGTALCLEYAARKHVPVLVLNPETFEITWQLNGWNKGDTNGTDGGHQS